MPNEELIIKISVPDGTLDKLNDGDALAKGLKLALGNHLFSQNLIAKDKVSSLDLSVSSDPNKQKGSAPPSNG